MRVVFWRDEAVVMSTDYFPEDQDWIPSTHMAAQNKITCNSSSKDLMMPSQLFRQQACMYILIYTEAKYPCT